MTLTDLHVLSVGSLNVAPIATYKLSQALLMLFPQMRCTSRGHPIPAIVPTKLFRSPTPWICKLPGCNGASAELKPG